VTTLHFGTPDAPHTGRARIRRNTVTVVEGVVPLRKLSSALVLAAVVASGAAHANAQPVVWDQGFGKGVTGLDWSDQSEGQNMADSVTFSNTTYITGYNFFGATDVSSETGSGAFQLKLLSNQVAQQDGQSVDQPYQPLLTENIGYTTSKQVCTGCVPGGFDAFELSFTFAPIKFDAGKTYWIGLSGNGFDADVLSVLGLQDDSMAQFEGNDFVFIASGANGEFVVGDQMFQLTGAVPEPANIALMGAGLALVAFAARRRRRA